MKGIFWIGGGLLTITSFQPMRQARKEDMPTFDATSYTRDGTTISIEGSCTINENSISCRSNGKRNPSLEKEVDPEFQKALKSSRWSIQVLFRPGWTTRLLVTKTIIAPNKNKAFWLQYIERGEQTGYFEYGDTRGTGRRVEKRVTIVTAKTGQKTIDLILNGPAKSSGQIMLPVMKGSERVSNGITAKLIDFNMTPFDEKTSDKQNFTCRIELKGATENQSNTMFVAPPPNEKVRQNPDFLKFVRPFLEVKSQKDNIYDLACVCVWQPTEIFVSATNYQRFRLKNIQLDQ